MEHTDRLDPILNLASQEAASRGAAAMDAEHLLLGMIREGYGVAAYVLKQLIGDLRPIADRIGGLASQARDRVLELLPFSQDGLRVMELAEQIANRHPNPHNEGPHLGSEHLLLALVEKPGAARDAILGVGLTPEAVRRTTLQLVGIAELPPAA
jgi:ATP-dependent Clp protease ATP-binding subunit ClpC